jgi:hypothetical protein
MPVVFWGVVTNIPKKPAAFASEGESTLHFDLYGHDLYLDLTRLAHTSMLLVVTRSSALAGGAASALRTCTGDMRPWTLAGTLAIYKEMFPGLLIPCSGIEPSLGHCHFQTVSS